MSKTPISRADRRAARTARVDALFGRAEDATAALDAFELLELAWHDCYAEITPSEEIIDDILFLSRGELAALIAAARLAVTDWRDLKMQVIARKRQ